jgi:hypothetical protein
MGGPPAKRGPRRKNPEKPKQPFYEPQALKDIKDNPKEFVLAEGRKRKKRKGSGGITIYRFTKPIADRIIQGLSIGLTLPKAATWVGIPDYTLIAWMRRGREGRAPYDDFVRRVEAAQVDWEADLLMYWVAITKGQLDKTRPQYWGIVTLLERKIKSEYSLSKPENTTIVNIDASTKNAIIEAENRARILEQQQQEELNQIAYNPTVQLPLITPSLNGVEIQDQEQAQKPQNTLKQGEELG